MIDPHAIATIAAKSHADFAISPPPGWPPNHRGALFSLGAHGEDGKVIACVIGMYNRSAIGPKEPPQKIQSGQSGCKRQTDASSVEIKEAADRGGLGPKPVRTFGDKQEQRKLRQSGYRNAHVDEQVIQGHSLGHRAAALLLLDHPAYDPIPANGKKTSHGKKGRRPSHQ